MKRFCACFIGVALVALSACGKTSSDGATTLSQAAFVDAYCGAVAKCCGAESLPHDPMTCSGVLSGFGGTFDALSSKSCLDDIAQSEKSDPEWCASYVSAPRCDDALAALRGEKGKGAGTPGSACTEAADCEPQPENSYVSCAAGGALSSPTTHECAEATVANGATSTCVGDIVFDAVGWPISNSASTATHPSAVCVGSFVQSCGPDGRCIDRLADGFAAPGAPCDLTHACALGFCANDGGSDVCPTHFAPDDGLRALCGGA